ncbi:helix-turn-helix domain-containing protein [Candidatus Bathyarchaeota archaeon]|jgi:excisionase family DNA binding protein|nr:helix-turn-helix domain-containing protein [Candidatus Bathyarchaeota archaeon]
MEQRDMYTVDEVGEALRFSRFTIYRLIKSGKLKATKPGDGKRRWRVRREDLEAYMEGGSDEILSNESV